MSVLISGCVKVAILFFLFTSFFFWPSGEKKLATGNFLCEKRSKIQSQWFCETNSKKITTIVQKLCSPFCYRI